MEIHVSAIFSNLKRPRHGLIIPFDGERVVLGKKSYIQDIPRLIGGGVDESEDPAAGATRELYEETGSKGPVTFLCELPIKATSDSGETAETTVYCYTAPIDAFTASDDLHGLVTVSLEEFRQINERMSQLSDQWFEGKKGRMNWHDWGTLYGAIQSAVYDKLTQK